ncbi:MAG: diguanylate cyclase [Pseudomonadota bacterium]
MSNIDPKPDGAAPPPAVRVLLVDDQLIIAEAMRRLLSGLDDIAYHFVTDAKRALDTALAFAPTVILQDLVLPDIDGFDLIALYRQHPALAQVPVIVLSSKEDPALKARSFAVLANDYLVKLPERAELLARIRYHSAAYVLRQRLDASERALAEAGLALLRLDRLDGATGIGNRRCFEDGAYAAWQRARHDGAPLGLLLCELDRPAPAQPAPAHAPDQADARWRMRTTAALLVTMLRGPADLAAHLGGGRFALLLPHATADEALALAHDCRHQLARLAMARPQAPGGGATLSIGIAVASAHAGPDQTPGSWIEQAEQALQQAQQGGRDRVVAAPAPSSTSPLNH